MKRKKILILGCDGYIGFPLALRCLHNNHIVVGIDNLSRRKCVEMIPSVSATRISKPANRTSDLSMIGDYRFLNLNIVGDSVNQIESLIKRYKFDTIVNLAHNPSAPYSMIDRKIAEHVLYNNYIGTNRLLWIIKEHSPDSHYITIGSTGEYDHTIGVDIEEGYFTFDHKGKTSKECLFPRQGNSIYHCCYDDKTEVLTECGWKLFDDIVSTDKIATLNQNSDSLEYQSPTNIFQYDYNGDLISIINESVDIMVTPNHNIFTHTTHSSDLVNWGMKTADDIFNKSQCIRRSVSNWQGVDKDIVLPEMDVTVNQHKSKVIPEIRISANNFVDFFGWWITEGSLSKYSVIISQDKIYNHDDIIESFEKMNLGRKISTNTSNGVIKGFSISHPQLSKWLEVFGKSQDKYIPKDLKGLSKPLLQRLLMCMLKGDGHIKDGFHKLYAQFYTSSKRLADDVQEISLKCGYAANISIVNRGDEPQDNEYVVSISENMTTQIIMSDSVVENRKSNPYNKIPYIGKVYCCEVPNSIIYVRRNGKSYWCGNSKVASTYLIDYLTRIWNLRCTDVMQSIVYGLYTTEMDKYRQINRCDTDESFGTVINRFVVQAMLGKPLTIFGHGKHQRAFLASNDSIQALELAINNPAEPGKVQTWNQLSEWHSIENIAEMVKEVIPGTKVEYIDSPRNEYTGGHYYHFETNNLKALGYEPTRTIKEEIEYMVSKIRITDANRDILESVVIPKVKFNRQK